MMQWLTGILALLGATLVLLAAIGVLRMPDLFTRMQAATKASTLGLGCLLGSRCSCARGLLLCGASHQHRRVRDVDLAGVELTSSPARRI